MDAAPGERYMTLGQWCEATGYSRRHAYRLIREGKIPAVQLVEGGQYRIPERLADRAIREHLCRCEVSP